MQIPREDNTCTIATNRSLWVANATCATDIAAYRYCSICLSSSNLVYLEPSRDRESAVHKGRQSGPQMPNWWRIAVCVPCAVQQRQEEETRKRNGRPLRDVVQSETDHETDGSTIVWPGSTRWNLGTLGTFRHKIEESSCAAKLFGMLESVCRRCSAPNRVAS